MSDAAMYDAADAVHRLCGALENGEPVDDENFRTARAWAAATICTRPPGESVPFDDLQGERKGKAVSTEMAWFLWRQEYAKWLAAHVPLDPAWVDAVGRLVRAHARCTRCSARGIQPVATPSKPPACPICGAQTVTEYD